MATNENLPPNVVKQLAKELKSPDESPPEGIKVGVSDGNFSIIYADIKGPRYFLTKSFHPNVANNGEICVNTLKKDWNPSLGLRHVLIVVWCLLIEPYPESALNEQAGKMLLENYEEYARHARLYTGIHALEPKSKFKTGAISGSTMALNMNQSNTSIRNVDKKNAASGAALLLPSTLVSSTSFTKGVGGDDQIASAVNPAIETGLSGSTAAAAATQKEGGGLVKVKAVKKKMDARKKSLKRL